MVFATCLRLTCECWHAKQVKWEAHAEIWRVLNRLDFASDSRLRPSCKWSAKLTAYCFLECDFFHSLPTLYPHYPRNVRRRSIFWRNFWERIPSQTLESQRFFLPTILYIISLKFPSTPTSPFTHPWEVLNLDTCLTYSECWEKFWYL